MAKHIVELTVTADYLNWTVEEAVRDLVQNGLDAHAKGHEFVCNYLSHSETLVLKNKGCSIPIKALLIGYSTKKCDETQLGQFGEGLKMSALSLVRLGHAVHIYTNGQRWTPFIEHSENFGEAVLKFAIEPDKYDEGVHISVTKITREMWASCKDLFLRLRDGVVNVPFEKDGTEVISNAEHRSVVYVGGIQVAKVKDPDLVYGYNFKPKVIAIDRDRRMVNTNELMSKTTSLWTKLALESDEAYKEFVDMVLDGAPDVREVRFDWNVPMALAERMVADFKAEYGDNAYPVKTSEGAEIRLLENTAVATKTVLKPDNYVDILRKVMPALSVMLESSKTDCFEVVPVWKMTPAERDCFHTCWIMALDAINDPEFAKIVRAEVVAYSDPSIDGTFRKNLNGSCVIRVSRRCLTSVGYTMSVLIHELSHRSGLHQDPEFLDSMERAWATVFGVMWGSLTQSFPKDHAPDQSDIVAAARYRIADVVGDL